MGGLGVLGLGHSMGPWRGAVERGRHRHGGRTPHSGAGTQLPPLPVQGGTGVWLHRRLLTTDPSQHITGSASSLQICSASSSPRQSNSEIY
ncbi:hypothetical protein ACP70R_049421 [Stipagrostis hirtigluma subsp. patula]